MSALDEFMQRHDEMCYCEMLKDYRPEKCECGNREACEELAALRTENAKLLGLIDQHEMKVEQDTIATLRAELAALKEATRWIPVQEKLPLSTSAVFAVCPNYLNPNIARYEREENKWYWGVPGRCRQVTHWMPIPKPDMENRETGIHGGDCRLEGSVVRSK